MQQPVDQRYPPGGYQGYCYRCGQWGHMARNCGENTNIASDIVHCDREISHISSPALKRVMSQSAFPPRTAFKKDKDYSIVRVGKSLLTQIKEDNFILGDTLSDELCNQVNEVVEQNVLITKASRPTTSAGYRNYAHPKINRQPQPLCPKAYLSLEKQQNR